MFTGWGKKRIINKNQLLSLDYDAYDITSLLLLIIKAGTAFSDRCVLCHRPTHLYQRSTSLHIFKLNKS